MHERLRHLAPLAGVVLFGAALWALHHALRDVRYHDVVLALRALPRSRVGLALVTTALGYGALTLYDTLACRYVGHPLPYRQTAFASFVGYAFSHTLGVPVLSGGAIRLRLYTAWGLSAAEVGGILAFNALTFWLGFAALGGAVLLVRPPHVPPTIPLPVHSLRGVGAVLLVLVVAYAMIGVFRKTPVVVAGRAFPVPAPRIVAPQLVIAAVDWTAASLTLWALLPPTPHLPLPMVMGAFLLAQTAGLASHLPGGLGVFETAIVLLLCPPLDAHEVAGSLIAFRAVYYLLPLILAAVALGAHELSRRQAVFQRVARVVEDWGSAVVPQVLSVAAFASGGLLLLSGAAPAVPSRLARVGQVLPLPLLEISHFLGSLAGIGLLVLARDLQRRIDAAWVLTTILLAIGTVLALLKGLDWEIALILAVTLAAFLPCRREFYRRTALLGERLSPGWTSAVLLVVGGTAWLLVFAHRHVAYAHELWWQFELTPSAPRALRATTGAVVFGIAVGAWMLRRPVRPEPGPTDPAELDAAQAIAAASPSTMAYLALTGDKRLFWSDDRHAFLMYDVEGRSWIALGDPVGPDDATTELAWRFRELADRHEGLCAFYQVTAARLPLYLDLGLSLQKLGEEGRVALRDFSLAGGQHKSLRQATRRLADDGITVRVVEPAEVAARMSELRAVSDAWLAEKHTREKGFSLGFFSPEYLRRFPAALVEQHGQLLAFANLWCGGGKDELSIDLMRHRPDAPRGVMDLLFAELMQWGSAQGYAWFNLGMAPLSGLPEHELSPLWNRVGAIVFRHGEHFYNFQGLRAYKEKFDPVWTPRYLAAPGGLHLARVLANLASLISGGLRGVVAK
jgi:phosphatidylglycerol lysyltransferase